MVLDPDARHEIQGMWRGVKAMSDIPESYVMLVGGMMPEARAYSAAPKEFQNLPFLLAYTVVEAVLSELIQQGMFRCSTWKLGPRMEASRPVVPWQDYDEVNRGRLLRNALAHDAKLLSRVTCLQYIRAIERELVAWQMLA